VHGGLVLVLWITGPPPSEKRTDREALEVRLAPPPAHVPREEDPPEELPPVELDQPTPDLLPEPPVVEPPLPDPEPLAPDPPLEPPESDSSPAPPPFETPPPATVSRRPKPRPAPVVVRHDPPALPTPALPRSRLQALHTPAPPFPAGTLAPGTAAELWLEYTIGADGVVVEAKVTRSSGHPALDAAVADFVRRTWRYHPPGSVRRVVRRFVFRPPA
jgi:TonB family protein